MNELTSAEKALYSPVDSLIETTEVIEQQKILLSDEQNDAINFCMENIDKGTLALAGPAGSGKTTLTKQLVSNLLDSGFQVTVSASTNKAALVLNNKGLPAVTLHTACMKPRFRPPINLLANCLEQANTVPHNEDVRVYREVRDEYGTTLLYEAFDKVRVTGVCSALRHLGIRDMFKYLESWEAKEPCEGVLIIDEASMVGKVEYQNARKVYERIILVGDEFQLAPVGSDAIFWEVSNRVSLKAIHRQAEGSQPLMLATNIRNKNPVHAKPIEEVDIEASRVGMPVICWTNKTRTTLTSKIREKLGYGGLPPQVGEYLICRNAQDRGAKARGLINNTIWKVIESNRYRCTLENDQGDIVKDESVFMEELDRGDGAPFRFAYVLTAHNAQGSEWPMVQIHTPDANSYYRFNESEGRRWLYTAVTRAQNHVRWIDRV